MLTDYGLKRTLDKLFIKNKEKHKVETHMLNIMAMFTSSHRFYNHLYTCHDRDVKSNVFRHQCTTQSCSTNFGSLQCDVKQIGSALTFICCHLFCSPINCFLAKNSCVSKWGGGQIQTRKTTRKGKFDHGIN